MEMRLSVCMLYYGEGKHGVAGCASEGAVDNRRGSERTDRLSANSTNTNTSPINTREPPDSQTSIADQPVRLRVDNGPK